MTRHNIKTAILTGDIVGSGALGPAKIQAAFASLEACAKRQQGWIGESLRFSRHRGDGWQVALHRPEMALRSALVFRTTLRALDRQFDCYIGMATGTVTTPLGPDLNLETAKVFTRSGRALEGLKTTGQPVRMAHADKGPVETAVILADHLFQSWTQTQAQAVAQALAHPDPVSYSDIAKRLGKSRQTVTKTLKAAGIEHLEMALAAMEKGRTDD